MHSRSIKPLPENVIRRIRAGEVIVHPYNVVKELIENSIDANARNICINIRGGGLELIEIKDDGDGIALDDFPYACARHTTSKITDFSELTIISSFGFRGEALYSITCSSHINITTRTIFDSEAITGDFINGQLVGQIGSAPGTKGTKVRVTRLFENDQIKLSTLTKRPKLTEKNCFINYEIFCSLSKTKLVTKKEDTFLWGKRLIQWMKYLDATVIASKNEKGSLKSKCDYLQSKANGSV